MDTLTNTSIVAAFIAGVAALFAPCCITVLLPSYLGSVFKERYKVVLMTFIFFLGILTVFLPIGLGAAALARFFSQYHNFIFTFGGLMLVGLGSSLILGKTFAIPSPVRPSIKNQSVLSVYVLGIFSAIATTCCAPVLAGVLALSATSGSIVWGGVYSLSFVLGMVAPLFIIATFLDKIDFTKKFSSLHKPLSANLFGYAYRSTISELTAGTVFLAMGVYIIYLALTNKLFMQSGYQLDINIFVANLVHRIHGFTQVIPETVWAGLVILVLFFITKYAIKQYKNYEK